MKKLSALFVLMLVCIGQAFAEETSARVLGPNDIKTDKSYIIYTAERGGLTVADASATTLSGTMQSGVNQDKNKDNVLQQFAFVADKFGNFYLYSLGSQKFVNSTGLSKDAIDPIQFANADATTVRLRFDNSHNINLAGSKQYLCDNWTTKDPGNSFIIEEAADFDQTAVAATINDFLNISNTSGQVLSVGRTLQLSTRKRPSDMEVIWSSSNSSVATVSVSGLVRSVAEGVAYIMVESAADSSLKDSCSIFVSNSSTIQYEVDGICYSLNLSNTTATVISKSDKYSGDISIPSSINCGGLCFDVLLSGKTQNSINYLPGAQ